MTQFKIGNSYYPKSPVLPSQNTSTAKKVEHFPKTAGSFAHQLQQSIQQAPLKFSHHAITRLEERGIKLSSIQMNRLENGMLKAREKGSNESLLLMEGLAFVVSVKNNTVITAMEQRAMAEQIITNIDSAVIL
jgi:flagellar operon protein